MHLLSLITLGFATFTSTWAAQISYIGPSSTLSSFHDPIIWSSKTIPTSQDEVILTQNTWLLIDKDSSINTLIINSGTSLYFNISSDQLAPLPILSLKGLAFGSGPVTAPMTIDGVILQISTIFDISPIISTSTPTMSFLNYASLSLASTSTAHFPSTIPITVAFSEASSVLGGIVNVTNDVTLMGAIELNQVNIGNNASLTVVGEFGKFVGRTTLSTSSSLHLRSKCFIDPTATIIGSSSSRITLDGNHHFTGTINLGVPIIIITGVTTFTQQVALTDVFVQYNATLAIDNNATISHIILYDNSTIGTFSNTQLHAGILVTNMTAILTTSHSFNIHGVNLVSSNNVNITSSSPVTINLSQNATWIWRTGSIITSNTDVTINTSDMTNARIVQGGDVTINTLTIHVCYSNTTTGNITGQLIIDIPPILVCTSNITDIVVPTLPPTPTPTGQPIQQSSSTGGLYVVIKTNAASCYDMTWSMLVFSLMLSMFFATLGI